MAEGKELDDVSTAIMCMDTLAMDSMDTPSKGASNADSDAADEALRTHPSSQEDDIDKTQDVNMDIVENDLEEDDDEGLMTDPGTPDTPGTPGTPQEEFAQGVDETIDMHVDGAEDDLEVEEAEEEEAAAATAEEEEETAAEEEAAEEEEQGSDHEAVPAEEAPEDVVGEKEKLSAPFPITRVKRIIKLDKDVRLVTSDAITLVAHATALFVQSLSSASFMVMLQTKRKTIRGPDVVLAATSTRQFRECLGNDLATLLETSNEDGPVEKEQLQQRKSAKKQQQLAPPPGRQAITNFFKSST